MSRVRGLGAAVLVVTVTLGTGVWVAPAVAAAVVIPTQDAVALGRALAGDASWVSGGAFEHLAGPGAAALVSGGVAGFPVTGEQAAMLSTGKAADITLPNTSSSTGTMLNGRAVRGDTDRDVTVLRVDLDVPATVNCLVGMDFRFLSEEFPEYVGSSFNDAFVAELDRSTWTTSGSTITAPDNFAFDPTGSPITINAAGTTSMDAAQAEGTTFDGATPMLTAAVPLNPGPHSLYLSIFDQGDSAYDSAVVVDNLRLGRVGDPADDCKPGATVVDRSEYVALGDSYSSGFGVAPYTDGTAPIDDDGTSNNCQRSPLAYGPLVAAARDLDLAFGACQGAITRDFYSPRDDFLREGDDRTQPWGEPRQLDYLSDDTGLFTLSIGGNDAQFGDAYLACATSTLTWTLCREKDDVTAPVYAAIARLDGRSASPGVITPYNDLFEDMRAKAPTATGVAVGYPVFFPADGRGRYIEGGGCEGIRPADQRWIVERIRQLNGVVAENARANGLLYAQPDFTGHELCGGSGDEWIFPLTDLSSIPPLHPGRVHPTAAGQAEMARAVRAVLDDDGFTRFSVRPEQTVTHSFEVGPGSPFISVVTGWPGSDVPLTLVSPSGTVYDRQFDGSGQRRVTGPTWEKVRVEAPEAGTWTASLYGLDVDPTGEPVTVSTYVAEPVNRAPAAALTTTVRGAEVVFDGSASTDADGTITAYEWYVSTPSGDDFFEGPTLRLPLTGASERSVALVVTDDRGATGFASDQLLPIDVKPGTSKNPVNRRSNGVTPMALLSTPTFDATKVDPTTVVVGPGQARPAETTVERDEVNGDGLVDQVLHVRIQALGLTATTTQLCLQGRLPADAGSFTGCDAVTVL